MVRLFLDSEWANDALRELVSLALISEDGQHVFYAERDPLPQMPSSFVRTTVYPLLERGGAAMADQLMTQTLREFLQPFGTSEIVADAPLDFTMLNRVWNGYGQPPHEAIYHTRLARQGNLMPRVEQYFQLNPSLRERRHHALVDAMALRSAWIVENYSFDGNVGDACSRDPGYDAWLVAKVEAALADPQPSIPHEDVMKGLRKRLEAIKAKKVAP